MPRPCRCILGFALIQTESVAPPVRVTVPAPMLRALDAAARELKCSREQLILTVLERYVEDLDDIAVVRERLRDPADAEVEWEVAKRELVAPDPP